MKLFTILILSTALNGPVSIDQVVDSYNVNEHGVKINYADGTGEWFEDVDIKTVQEDEEGLYILLKDGTGYWIEKEGL